MAKNIVICSDGTGNSANKGRGTNVFRLYEAVDLADQAGAATQVAYYDDGVGTESNRLCSILTGAVGWGLSRNVRQLYCWLSATYEPGDNIYLFGFSRGAFTVRTLVGFVDECGLIAADKYKTPKELQSLTAQAYLVYRRRYEAWLDPLWRRLTFLFLSYKLKQLWRGLMFFLPSHRLKQPRFESCHSVFPNIRFLGVWDTVDAVGFPVTGVAKTFNRLIYQYKFRDNHLSPSVERAAQALSIDDERETFCPELWHEQDPITKARDPRFSQVWFPGAHSDVGGGYPRRGLSSAALDWMMTLASEANPASPLRFNTQDVARARSAKNAHDKLHDSRRGLGIYYRYAPREVGRLCSKFGVEVKVHESAVARMRTATDGYAPLALPGAFEQVSTDGSTNTIKMSAEAETEFARTKPWVRVRVGVQFGFYAVTAFLLGLGAVMNVSQPSTLSRGLGQSVAAFVPVGKKYVENLIHALLSEPAYWAGIVIGLGVLFPLRLYARAKINEYAARSWRSTFRPRSVVSPPSPPSKPRYEPADARGPLPPRALP